MLNIKNSNTHPSMDTVFKNLSCDTVLRKDSFCFFFLIVVICITFTREFIVKLSDKTQVKNWVRADAHVESTESFSNLFAWQSGSRTHTWFSSLWKLALPALKGGVLTTYQEAQHNKGRRPETVRQSLGEERVKRREENFNKNTGRQERINFRQQFHH